MNHDSRGLSWQLAPRQMHGGFPCQPSSRLPIGIYTPTAVEYLPHNSEARRVVQSIAALVVTPANNLQIEHIGSTAVPGCWGKGIIDLLVIYPPGGLKSARQALDRIGFQRQGGAAPFPESRPMRVGSFAHFGRSHRIHAHVMESGSAEAQDLIRFRDLLRQDIDLRRAYEAEKRAILARGITKGNEYSEAKGEFIRRALGDRPERL
jgi:GrpB-like predicted nucleotidyltransferase (UPF0157 family)